ncbi:hypothetical protein [Rhodohalobacter sp. 8-1]|uniref:hypothetical protein n=1 Tax=Rhodohalobacter sp. 8-1 TaxID=3131972 RepID=UPI0030EF3D66
MINLNSKLKRSTLLSSLSFQHKKSDAPKRKVNIPIIAIFLVGLFFVLTSCNQEFQPLESNDRYFFSMYGLIDVGADTQWVRVTPVREQIDLLSDGSDLKVTLQNLETGREVTLKDSLFTQGRNVLNFWTDEPIVHNQTYRLKAELPTGEMSEVTVTTPNEMPVPKVVVFTFPGSPPDYFVFVDKNVNLADIQVKYYVRLLASDLDVQRIFTFAYRNKAEIINDFPDYYTVEIDPDAELKEIERQVLLPPDGVIEVVNRQVYVATSAVEWNEDIEMLDDVIYTLPQTLLNVNKGLGYVLGVDSKYIPYRGCLDEISFPIPCGEEEPFW